MRKFFVENLGCAKNQVDAEVMIAALQNEGWLFVSDSDEAELIIINSCGFIQTAKEESIQVSLEMKERYPGKKIMLAGCFAQRYGEELTGSLPELDGIFGNRVLSRVSETAEKVMAGLKPVDLPESDEVSDVSATADGEKVQNEVKRKQILSFKGSVYIKISEGCNNGCSYCAIPLIRGGLKSRSISSIIREIKSFLSEGYVEFNFVGQDLGSFGADRGEAEFITLLKEISKIEGKFWIRLLYIHPDHFPEGLLTVCKEDPRILPYFDIPFQHASGPILKKMGRRGNREKYLSLINRIREEVPQAVIRSTFLVGFPGESNEDFRELLEFQNDARIDWLGVFSYSREEGTSAARLAGPFSYKFHRKMREKRKDKINLLQQAVTEERMSRFVGQEMDVLIEEKVEGEDLFLGRGYLQAPDVDGLIVINSENLECGRLVRCKIVKQNGIDLEAVPLI
ncbi:MAG: 30S ribosomal protein S12 methylthiotransferase RimO [Spirochaetales bacterium]|nr:30S ribosomal protein S12 methylthiotransferase RimO [Spirochaetales bacterium]